MKLIEKWNRKCFWSLYQWCLLVMVFVSIYFLDPRRSLAAAIFVACRVKFSYFGNAGLKV